MRPKRLGIRFEGFEGLAEARALAVAAEAAGASSIWMTQHLGGRDAPTLATIIASGTQRIRVVPSNLSPFIAHPTTVAMMLATLSEFAPGRVAASIGIGNPLDLSQSGAVVEDAEDAVHHLRVRLDQRLGLWEVFGTAALDEVAGERPRRTGEAEQGLIQPEFFAKDGEGVVDILQTVGGAFEFQRGDVGRRGQRSLHGDAAFVAETVTDAQGFGDDEDVREQDRGVELRKTAEGLQRDLDREFGRADHRDEIGFRLECAVFRQVATGLTHDPDRSPVMGLSVEGGEKAVAGVHQDPFSQSCGFR